VDILEIAAGDIDGFAVDQCIGDNLSGTLNNAAECGPGNAHAVTAVLMTEIFQVRQTDRFSFVHR
jgi:hypothetical protein